ncbi:hypothetical protein HDV00_011463 [Rhizophlyctis rosea]|nr:hypothetical protein HDV00_011463 [Rhizophlyctis rosea]
MAKLSIPVNPVNSPTLQSVWSSYDSATKKWSFNGYEIQFTLDKAVVTGRIAKLDLFLVMLYLLKFKTQAATQWFSVAEIIHKQWWEMEDDGRKDSFSCTVNGQEVYYVIADTSTADTAAPAETQRSLPRRETKSKSKSLATVGLKIGLKVGAAMLGGSFN